MSTQQVTDHSTFLYRSKSLSYDISCPDNMTSVTSDVESQIDEVRRAECSATSSYLLQNFGIVMVARKLGHTIPHVLPRACQSAKRALDVLACGLHLILPPLVSEQT